MAPRLPNAIDVVIPHYNDPVRLERCLAALMPQLGPDDGAIVADNGSDADLSAVTARWPRLRLVHQPEMGAGPARNAGAAEATAPWLAFLDADCVPDPDWLSMARDTAQEGAILGGLVTLFDETVPPRSGAEAFEAAFAFRVESYLEKGFLPSCQLLMARSAFSRVGEFGVAVSEDVDWSRRATEVGLTLALEPRLRIAHPARQDWPALRRKWRRLASEAFLTEARSPKGRVLWAMKALAMPVSILVHLPRVLGHGGLSPGEKARGAGTLARLRLARMVWMLGQAATGRA